MQSSPLLISFYKDLVKYAAIIYLFFQVAIISVIPELTIFDELIQFSFLVGIIALSYKNESAKFALKFYLAITFVMALMSLHAISHRGIVNVAFQVFVHTKYILYVSALFIFFDVSRVKKLIAAFMLISVLFLIFDLLDNLLVH